MRLRIKHPFRLALVPMLVWFARPVPAAAQEPDSVDEWDATLARGETREIDFTTREGTWMSVDVSPDGEWIVFDLLAHIYRVPSDGGEAENLTQNSGVAVNFHPQYSPDGELIAFVSDRDGQNNLWVMEADGSNPRQVFRDLNVRVTEPTWTADGDYILVTRRALDGGEGGSGIWMYHKDGGEGAEILGSDAGRVSWATISADGRYMYFQVPTPGQTVVWTAPGQHGKTVSDLLQGAYQIRRLDLRTGVASPITAGGPTRQIRLSSGGAIAPEVSPDGRWLAFARRIPGGTISFKGHEFGPRTALWLRDLETGRERVIMDPIEQDMAEGMKTLRVLPGYSWTRDGSAIVIAQGGKIRRLDVESGGVETIPFNARVHRVISEQAYTPFRISDGPFEATFVRWHTTSPDGSKLVFQAIGKLWISDLPAEPGAGVLTLSAPPRRLTPESFDPFEYAPAWSPDGRWVAFTSWGGPDGGHLWKIPAEGGPPERLTTEPGEYIHPAWSADGSRIAVARGSGASFRAWSMVHNPYYDVVTVPASGGPATRVARASIPGEQSFFTTSRSQIVRPTFAGGRIFYPQLAVEADGQDEVVTRLVSVLPDGSDRREHLTFPYADEVIPSPDGKWVAFNEGDNVYLVPVPAAGLGDGPIRIDKRRAKLPVRQLSEEGGIYPRWRDGRTVEFGSGQRYFAYDIVSEQTDTVRIELRVPRYIPEGTIALTDARIVTLEHRRVIERGAIVVEGARIACVGECDVSGADRVVDAGGTTIIPGFVDMHSHLFREYRGIFPQQMFETGVALAYGVTTNLDNSMWSQDVFPVAEMIEAGALTGPRTYSTGDPLYAGDRGRQNKLTSYEVAEKNIARLQSWGAVSIKQYMQPRRAQRQWVSDVAREKGLMVTAEGGDLPYNLSMIMDGQTGWEHPLSYIPLYSDVAKFFGQSEAVYSPTLVVGGPGPWNDEYFFQEYEMWKNPKLRRWMPWRQLFPHTRRRMLRPETDYSFPLLAQGLADIMAEGGHGAIGAHGQQHGIASHWEVWMAASAMGPMGALELASREGAYFLGVQQDIGSIAVGKLADLMVLNSNPLEDIHNTADIRYVMKSGVLYDADTLDELWPQQREYGPRPWVDPAALRNDVRPINYWDLPRNR